MLNSNKIYLFDTNVLVQAKNLYYRFCFCRQFWDTVLLGHEKGIFYSTKSVKNEISKGNQDDEVRVWMEEVLPDSFFIDDINDQEINKIYSQLMTWAATSTFYTPKAIKEFARNDIADARLIATSKSLGYSIVSQENSDPNRKNKILIPQAADFIGAQWIYVYDMLSEVCDNNFALK